MGEQPRGLIQVLLDAGAEFGDRHDAAMDLGAFDGEEVEAALALLACDTSTDPDLADACGESLAEVWCRKGHFEQDVLTRLTPEALHIALGTMRAHDPRLAAEADGILGRGGDAKKS
jgi:hypothetical protein